MCAVNLIVWRKRPELSRGRGFPTLTRGAKHDHIVAVLCRRDLAPHPNIQISVGSFPRSAYSSDFSSHEAMMHQVTQHLYWATSNNVVCSGEQSTKCSGAQTRANHTTAATCDPTTVGCSTANTLAGSRRTIFPPRPRSRPPPTPPLLLGSISPTLQWLDFSVHVTSHTGPCARSPERRHEQRLFGQLYQSSFKA